MSQLSEAAPRVLQEMLPQLGITIWTTTPWTMPGNAGASNSSMDPFGRIVRFHRALLGYTEAPGQLNEAEPETSC